MAVFHGFATARPELSPDRAHSDAMRRVLAVAVVLSAVWTSATTVAAQPQVDQVQRDCVWPAVGGAVAGVAIAWYGFAGIEAVRGGSAYDLDATASNVALVLSLETVGLVGGATVGCAVWGDEGRRFPTAGSVIAGGIAGAGLGALAAFGAIASAGIDSDTDSPMASVLIMVTGTAGGAFAGGWLGLKLDRWLRGPPLIAPVADGERLGLAVRFKL